METIKAIAKGIQVLVSLVFLISFSGMGGCTNNDGDAPATTTPPTPPQSVTPTGPMQLELSFSNGAARLNQSAELRCILKVGSTIADDANIRMSLPDGIELVSDSDIWPLGYLTQYETREIKAIIKPVKIGNFTIEFIRSYIPIEKGENPGTGIYKIYLSVSESSSQWSAVYPPWLPTGVTAKPTPATPVTP